ncbi:hypothetical protein MNEG_15704 [Monoraphidium neglectum]|uniref:Acetyl-CoA carboxylase central domain-containing protein n=1 Tax=Monoraphidium neglectum TaxID=145388 RepID=A0A0D2LJV6_9CHLO|nr:hypothetical protein MNEG_15704 [Monoraphidium neglectum]KIY92259.1 hypothetical protein MNEG_15704 [Monoraphidium neglectum]|eukprot:XP_013891279.1 hypothetical protein MNEG_15704 [Monoraphidium neglectum]
MLAHHLPCPGGALWRTAADRRLVSISGGKVVAAWIYDDPRLANTSHARHQGGAFLVVPSLAELEGALPAVAHAMSALGTDCAGGTLHVAVCGSDAVKLSPGAEQLLAGGALGAAEPGAKVFSSAELISHDAPAAAAAHGNGNGAAALARGAGMGPQEKARRVAAAVADAKATLRRLQVATVSVLAPGMSTMPLRSGFVWDEAADCFKYDPFLRQVEGPVARLLELDKLSSQQVAYTPSRNRQWHMYACSDREPRGPELKRLFLRGQVRQLGHPALLAAQYSGNTPAVAAAAVKELEEALPPSRGARVPLAARAPALRPPPTPRRGSPFSP